MKNFIVKWLINTAGIMLIAKIVPGINIESYQTAVIAALVLGLINAFIKPMIILITLPINILSLGIFTFFINTFVFYISSKFVKGFTIADFWSAFWGALCLSVISFILNSFAGKHGRIEINNGFMGRKAGPSYPNAIDAEIVEEKKQENKQLHS